MCVSNTGDHAFRTKTGTCTITPDQIVWSREGVRGAAAQQTFGNSIGRALLIYGLLGGGALVFGVWRLLRGDTFPGVVFSLIGVFFLWSIFRSRHCSAVPVINRSAIRAVEAHRPRPPLTRGYFVVLFEERGRARKRFIMLPGSWANGGEEYARAEAAMRASGLLSTS